MTINPSFIDLEEYNEYIKLKLIKLYQYYQLKASLVIHQ